PDSITALLNADASPHARSHSGSTPFYRATRSGSVEALNLLYNAGSDINATTWNNWTPICEAIAHRHYESVSLLIQWGANICIRTANGLTPVDLARKIGDSSLIVLLERELQKKG